MATQRTEQLADVLAAAALSERERRVVERMAAAFREEIGGDLRPVWLSRASSAPPTTRCSTRPAAPEEAKAIVEGAVEFSAAVEAMLD